MGLRLEQGQLTQVNEVLLAHGGGVGRDDVGGLELAVVDEFGGGGVLRECALHEEP